MPNVSQHSMNWLPTTRRSGSDSWRHPGPSSTQMFSTLSGLRNFLMHLALTGIFRAHWSTDVHEEWMRNLLSRIGPISHVKNLNVPDT